jgi:glycosyltransferase involved in cell wall biosynthesis
MSVMDALVSAMPAEDARDPAHDGAPARPQRDISIAMATYNGAAVLEEQLDSLETQTLKPDELVVCDDRSSDATVEILQRFAARASFPVRIHVNPERLGWRANFMKASGLCSHELIAFCDQDDVWYPDKLATMTPHFADASVLMVYHNADLVDAKAVAYDTWLPLTDVIERMGPLSRPTAWINPNGLTMMFRHALTRFNDLWPDTDWTPAPEHPFAHDQWFFDLATNLGTVLLLPERLLAYRQHGGNSVGWTNVHRTKRAWPTCDDARTQVDDALRRVEPFCRALRKAVAREDGELRDALENALAKNQRLVDRLESRRALYADDSLPRRLRTLGGLIARRVYAQDDDWGLGKRALLMDASVGLFSRERRPRTSP